MCEGFELSMFSYMNWIGWILNGVRCYTNICDTLKIMKITSCHEHNYVAYLCIECNSG